jgi:tRNA (adenine37-N6)-methyltransferase
MNAHTFELRQIGTIHRTEAGIRLEIAEAYRPAMKQLDHFSHVMVLWWAHGLDEDDWRGTLQTDPPYAPGHLSGVFATRAPYRPNPLGVTMCKILGMDEDAGTLTVGDIDALEGTPIVDLKAYFPVCDRVRDATIPDWLEGWPEWMPDEGVGLEEYEK